MRKASVVSMFIVAGIILLADGDALLVTSEAKDEREAPRIDEESSPPNQVMVDGHSQINGRQPTPADSHEEVLSSEMDCNYEETSTSHQCQDDADLSLVHSEEEVNPDSDGSSESHHSRPALQEQEDSVDEDGAAKCPDDSSQDPRTREEVSRIEDGKAKKPDDNMEMKTRRDNEGAEGSSSSPSSAPTDSHQDISMEDLLTVLGMIVSMVIICYFLLMGILRAMEAIDDYWFSWEHL